MMFVFTKQLVKTYLDTWIIYEKKTDIFVKTNNNGKEKRNTMLPETVQCRRY